MNPSNDAPHYDSATDKRTGPLWGRYNVIGWLTLIAFLKNWGVDVSEFANHNDGAPITAKTCLKVANAIEEHLAELRESDRAWLASHIVLWRTCGGYYQL
jgi:hypothetical protein